MRALPSISRSATVRTHLGRPAIVNGRPGAFVALPDRVVSLVAFTIVGDRVTEMDLLVDPVKLQHVRLRVPQDG